MKWGIFLVRLLVGAIFFTFGLNFFLKFLDMPPMEGDAGVYTNLLYGSGYLKVVKILEVIVGVILILGFLVPVVITILTPIAVNILLFEVCILDKPGPMGIGLNVLLLFLIIGYWSAFQNVFNPSVKPFNAKKPVSS